MPLLSPVRSCSSVKRFEGKPERSVERLGSTDLKAPESDLLVVEMEGLADLPVVHLEVGEEGRLLLPKEERRPDLD